MQNAFIYLPSVLVASVATMVLASIWYSPALFGKQWMALVGMKKEKMTAAQKKGMCKNYVYGFVVNVVMLSVLDFFLRALGVTVVTDALQVALLFWLGFIATVGSGMVIWERKPFALYAIYTGYSLVMMLMSAAILVAW